MSRHDADWVALGVMLPEAAADLVATFFVEEGAPGVLVDPGSAMADPPRSGFVRLEAHVRASESERIGTALESYLRALADVVPETAGATVSRAPVPALDWEAAFRSHHKPTEVGRRLLVAPPWDVPDITDRLSIMVDPGMAFGTGQHATTRGCLEEIEDAVDAGVRSGLDVGTGSGILAVAMSRLGMAPVVATDIDPLAVSLARETCKANDAEAVRLVTGRADAVRGPYDLVVANLLAAPLIEEAATLAACVATGGRLVVSGLLAEQVGDVATAYPAWRIVHTRAEDPWRTLRFERGA